MRRTSRRSTPSLRDLEQALVALCAAGLALEELGLDDESDPPEAMTTEEAAALQRHLGQKLGKYDLYIVIYEPYDLDSSPVTGSLADDIADIYRDVQDGFAELRDGKFANANWQMEARIRQPLGPPCLRGYLRALHHPLSAVRVTVPNTRPTSATYPLR